MVALQIDMAAPAKRAALFGLFDQRLSGNLLALYVLQAANYLAPMAILPWLTRVLGPDGYGQMGLAVALVAYAAILVDYGFSLSATRKIAVNPDDRAACSEIFWATLACKSILFLAAVALLLILTYIVPRFAEIRELVVIGSLTLAGTVLTPVWYYQGMQRMQAFAAISALVRLASIPLIYLCVVSPDDAPVAVLIQSGAFAVIGIVTFLALLLSREVLRPAITFAQCRDAFKDGAVLFFANAGVSLYAAATIIILGLVSDNTQVAYFAACMAVMRAIKGLITPFSQALYPRMSHLMVHDRKYAHCALRTSAIIVVAVSCAMAGMLYVYAGTVVSLVFGSEFGYAATILQWLAPTVVLVSISNMLSVQVMLPLGYQKALTMIVLIAGVFNVLLLIPLAHLYGCAGAAITIFLTETIVAAAMIAFLWFKHPRMLQVDV